MNRQDKRHGGRIMTPVGEQFTQPEEDAICPARSVEYKKLGMNFSVLLYISDGYLLGWPLG